MLHTRLIKKPVSTIVETLYTKGKVLGRRTDYGFNTTYVIFNHRKYRITAIGGKVMFVSCGKWTSKENKA